MNTYLQEMKNALTGYYNAARSCAQKAQEARQMYRDDIASETIKKLYAQLEVNKAASINTINEVREKAIEAANRWGVLDGSKLNDGDMKLLKLDLSAEQFQAIVNRNKNNGTMCHALAQYARKHGAAEAGQADSNIFDNLSSVVIPTVEGQITAYNKFADSAISIIRGMGEHEKEFGQGLTEFLVENFGKPDGANRKLLEMIS